MAIRSDEITSIIKASIDSFDAGIESRSVGTVVEVGDGIAQIYGLDAAQEGRVDGGLERDLATCQLFEAGGDRPDLVGSQGRGARGGGVGQSIALVVEPPELGGDAWQLLDPAAPDHEQR